MGRHHHGRVARVHAGKFDVLQHAADHGSLTVGDTIYVKFVGILEELVEKHGRAGRHVEDFAHDFLHFVHIVDDKHATTAEDEGGAQEDREADLAC